MMYNNVDVFGIIAGASNIRTGDNPPYTSEDFLNAYPQFGKKDEVTRQPIIPTVVLNAWIKMANASISKARYHDAWELCMGLFIAHFLTLYLQTMASPNDPVGKIINSGLAKGMVASKSASDLSISYDFSIISGQEFAGWGTYKLTAFGQQFITLARMYSMGGMVVW